MKKIIKLNSGTLYDPTVLDKAFNENEYIIIESGFYILRNNVVIHELKGSSQVNVMRESSQVKEMRESSQVNVMRGSSQVNVMRGSSQVKEMWESSQVKEMRESSQVKEMWGSSQVKEMWGSSQVNVMRESSQVKEMWGSGLINRVLGHNNTINCFGFNLIRIDKDSSKDGIVLNDTSSLLLLPSIEGNFDVFSKNYPVKTNNGSAILYKAVHKINGKYIADYDKSTEYKIGEKTKTFCDQSTVESCSKGIHISYLEWAVRFGKQWNDMVILECEIEIATTVISKDCDGKVRNAEVLPLREVPKKEYENFL